jgi:hypothetical protein
MRQKNQYIPLICPLFLPKTNIMRLPIALSPLNVFLLLLMLLSPFLGRKTKEYISSGQQEQKIEEWVSAVSVAEKKEAPVETKSNSVKTPETPSPGKNRIHNHGEEIPLGQSLIARYREKGKSTPRSLKKRAELRVERETPQNVSDSEIAVNKTEEINSPENIESPENASEKRRQELFKLIREYAKAGDQESAEKAFMETLENMDIAPLETLERLSTFREHFDRLSEQLSS